MAFNTAPGALINFAGGLLIIALGIIILAVRPKRRANQAFFAMAVGFGEWVCVFNLIYRQPGQLAAMLWYVNAPFALLGVLGALALVYWYPYRLPRSEAKRLVLPAAALTLLLVWVMVHVLSNQTQNVTGWGVPQDSHRSWIPTFILGWFTFPTFAFFSLAMAIRFRSALRAGRRFDELPVVGLALAPYAGVTSASFIFIEDGLVWAKWGILAMLYSAAFAWLLIQDPATRRLRLFVGLVIAASPLIGIALTLWLGGYQDAINAGIYGLARAIGVALMAFAIIRHQVFGIDLRVRRGISQSTVAALFIAAFFVASELAAQVFSATSAGPIVGILAAGVLVFFLAPMQRWAERFAGAATVDAKPAAEASPYERVEIYRRQAIAAWADGSIDRKERELLDALRGTLGLDGETTSRLESEAASVALGAR